MSLITVDLRDRKQLYEQLIDNIKGLILSGELSPDNKLPSVRSLARELGINPNTIQKAYSELERMGVITTLPGRGSIILADINILRGEQEERLVNRFMTMASDAKKSGITKEKYIRSALEAWEKVGGKTDDKN